MSKFYFGDDSSSEDDNLPYPTPLPRSAFLTPDYSPTSFLSTLRNRHQTLEDLRSELRSRSQLLSKELLDLVNSNYQDFLGLGQSLKGGEDKVEQVRLGLLGFQREAQGIRARVAEREKEAEKLIGEKRTLRQQVLVGRTLLEISERLDELEGILMVSGTEKQAQEDDDSVFSDSDESEEGEDDATSDGVGFTTTKRLQRRVQQYLLIQRLFDRIGPDHPFLITQEERLIRIRNTILLDLSSALKQAKGLGDEGKDRLLQIMAMYRDMNEFAEAVRVVKSK